MGEGGIRNLKLLQQSVSMTTMY